MSKRLLHFIIATLLVAAVGQARAHGASDAADKAKTLSSERVEQAGMHIVWQQQLLTFKGKGRRQKDIAVPIRRAYLYEKTILIESKDNFLYSFDRETGQGQWVAELPDSLQIAPTSYDRRYWTISAGRVAAIDSTGAVAVGEPFPNSPTAPLVVTDDYFYVAAADGALYKLDRKELSPVWPAPTRTNGVILSQPVRAEDLLLLAASDGEVLGVDLINGARRIELSGLGQILGGIATDWPDSDDFYFGSSDFNVYCYSAMGSLNWRTLLQERPSNTPVIAGDLLYVDSIGGGLWALNRSDGAVAWYNPGNGVTIEWLPVAETQDETGIQDLRAGKQVAGMEWFPYDRRLIEDAAKRGEKLHAGLQVEADQNDKLVAEMMTDAYTAQDSQARPEVALNLNDEGKQRYEKMLALHAGGRIAIVLNDEIVDVMDVPPLASLDSSDAAPAAVHQPILKGLTSASQAKLDAAEINTAIQKTPNATETRAFIASGGANVFRIAKKGEVWMLDAATGRIKHRLALPDDITIAPRNRYGDGLVYLASPKDGMLYCLKAR